MKRWRVAPVALFAIVLAGCNLKSDLSSGSGGGGGDPTSSPSPTAPQAALVYDTIPDTLPPSLPSEAFEATSTAEFGDSVTLAGSARAGDTATIVMVTWSTQAYSYPITLKLYDAGNLATPFATRTQTFQIPARPAADPSCPNSEWLASDGCHNGFAFTITFDLTGITLPDSFVYSIALNTQNYGQTPTGVSGPYDSLNFGLASAPPTVGGRVDGTIYQNSSWSGAYSGTGTPGVFGPDTGWSPYVPAAKFFAF